MQRIHRLMPAGPAAAYKTYQVASPLSTHTRPATCGEVDCPQHRAGWVTKVDERTDLGLRQAAYIRHACRPVTAQLADGRGVRRYTESSDPTGLTVFTFPSGQECFNEHRVPLGRPELFIVKGGDWRGNPARTPVRRHTRPEHWLEDFADHQQRLADRIDRG